MKVESPIRVFRSGEKGVDERMRRMRERLSLFTDAVTLESARKTREVFGRPLKPLEAVRKILGDIHRDGDRALFHYTRKFDGVRLKPGTLRVGKKEIESSRKMVSPRFLAAVKRAIQNVRAFQKRIKVRLPKAFLGKGIRLEMRLRPLKRIGVYVPGGEAALGSSLYMCAVPAQVAGVKEIAVATPCGRDGRVAPEVLAVASMLGLSEIYQIGGAQAIGALAFGTASVRPVDKIVGPGNIFVTLAKKEVFGTVDIDLFAGPSEIVVIADDSANPAYVASDLLAQAEHNSASPMLLTPSEKLASQVVEELEKQLPRLERKGAGAAREALSRFGFILITRDLPEAIEMANALAPEHLEIQTRSPGRILPKIENAGAVFLGPTTPEAIGDYLAGPSHTLPTGGTARFLSGLSVNDFLKWTSVMEYSSRALKALSRHAIEIARSERLWAHANSISIRLAVRRRKWKRG